MSSSSKLVAMLLEISINLLPKTFDVIINPAYPLRLLQCTKYKSISPEQSLKELRNTFKIKAGYYLELLILDVSKLSKFSYNLVDFNVKVKFM